MSWNTISKRKTVIWNNTFTETKTRDPVFSTLKHHPIIQEKNGKKKKWYGNKILLTNRKLYTFTFKLTRLL